MKVLVSCYYTGEYNLVRGRVISVPPYFYDSKGVMSNVHNTSLYELDQSNNKYPIMCAGSL